MRKEVDILWLVEHVAREMDVACIVKCLLKKRHGLEVEIKHIYLHAEEIMKTRLPKVVTLPFFYNSADLAVDDYVKVWPDATYFNLSWEEIFYKGHLKIKAPSDDFARNRVIHHSWGNFYKSYLISNGVNENNIFLNGNPAYQLYLPPYCEFYNDRNSLAQKYGLDNNKRWIFIPENYRWAFLTDGTIKNKLKTGADYEEMIGMRKFCRDSLGEVLRWCNQTAQTESKGIEVIFRPKPVTMLQEMESFFNEKVGKEISTGLHFIKGESVREWILSSDVVISSFSTTLIEAAIAGKPAYMVEPLPISEAFSADWYDYVSRIKNADDFRNACLVDEPEKVKHLKKWAMEEMLSNGDPISNLADFTNGLLQKRDNIALTCGQPGFREKDYFSHRTHENDYFSDQDIHTNVYEWGKILNIDYPPPAYKRMSVIICTYNRADLLGKCLESLCRQSESTSPCDIIVIDNNSTDNTRELVIQYSKEYPNFKYVFEPKQGLSHARNRGCQEASSEYLVYLDDDAVAPPEYLSSILKVIKQHSPDIMGGPVSPYYTSGKPRWFKDEYEIRKTAEESGFSSRCTVSGGNFIIKKKLLGELGGFDPLFGISGNTLGMCEERKVLEQYRSETPLSKQKVYYALECNILHYVPDNKMRLSYMLRRSFLGGLSAARIEIHYKFNNSLAAAVKSKMRTLINKFRSPHVRGNEQELKEHTGISRKNDIVLQLRKLSNMLGQTTAILHHFLRKNFFIILM